MTGFESGSWRAAAKRAGNTRNGGVFGMDDPTQDWQSPGEKSGAGQEIRLPCPFHKKDPVEHQGRTCSSSGFKQITRLKEHLYRVHTLHQCNRCNEQFKDQEQLFEHGTKIEACNLAAVKTRIDGVTPQMVARLKTRRTFFKKTEVEQWYIIWDILFPDAARPVSLNPITQQNLSSSLEQAARIADPKFRIIRHWEDLRDHLEKEGFSSELIMRHKDVLFEIFNDSHSEEPKLHSTPGDLWTETNKLDTPKAFISDGSDYPYSTTADLQLISDIVFPPLNNEESDFKDFLPSFALPDPDPHLVNGLWESDFDYGDSALSWMQNIAGTPKPPEKLALEEHMTFTKARENPAAESGHVLAARGPADNNKVQEDLKFVVTRSQELMIEDDLNDKFISFVADDIFDSLELQVKLRDRPSTSGDIPTLAGYLEDFSTKLQFITEHGIQRDIAISIGQHRNRIAVALVALVARLQPNLETGDSGLTASITKKVGRTGRQERKESEDYIANQFEKARRYLTESQTYSWLIGRLQAEVLLTSRKGTALENVKQVLVRALTEVRHRLINYGHDYAIQTIKFDVVWDPFSFLQRQFPSIAAPSLSSLIVINGSEVDAQCSTAGQYIEQTWPTTGPELLRVLEESVARYLVERSSEYWLSDGCLLRIVLYKPKLVVYATGLDQTLIELGEVLAWIGAALRESPDPNSIAYTTPRIQNENGTSLSFILDAEIDVQTADSAQLQNGTCWHYLFRNPVIVRGSPILARGDEEKGLEIPLEMMTGLGLTPRATNFDNGLVLKGFSTMFVPIKSVESSILWHFLFNEDETRMSYLNASKLCYGRLHMDYVSISSLERGRHFLGWSSSTESFTGSMNVHYGDIGWPAPDSFASAGVALDKKMTLAVSKIVGIGATFSRGAKDTPLYLTGAATYEQEIQHAEKMYVVLYDISDRRGWLVNGANALLHLTCTQLVTVWAERSQLLKNQLQGFQYAAPADGVMAASAALLNGSNRKMLISEQVEEWKAVVKTVPDQATTHNDTATKTEHHQKVTYWTYQNLVSQTYHVLEQMQDYQVKMLTAPGKNLRLTDRDKLVGFAFMDIVDGPSIIDPRVATLKPSGKGWVEFTRSIRAITLFGTCFGQLMKPGKSSNSLCKKWKRVPAGRDYLTASISTLHHICKREGDRHAEPMALARGVYWHKAHLMFESCTCKPGNKGSSCDRVQVLLPPSLGPKTHPQPFEHLNGAVIFGRSKRFGWNWPQTGDPIPEDVSESDFDEYNQEDDTALSTSPQSRSSNDEKISVIFSPTPEFITTPGSQGSTPLPMPGVRAEAEKRPSPRIPSSVLDEEHYGQATHSPASDLEDEDNTGPSQVPTSILSPIKKGAKNLDLRQAFHKSSKARDEPSERSEQKHAKRMQENAEDSLDDTGLLPSKRVKSRHSTVPKLSFAPSPS